MPALEERVAALEAQVADLKEMVATDVLHKVEEFGVPESQLKWEPNGPPMVGGNIQFWRGDVADQPGVPKTLSVIHKAQAKSITPWAVFVHLETSHDYKGGGGAGVNVNLVQVGAGWATAFHAEPYHLGTGTTIGVNVESRSRGVKGGHCHAVVLKANERQYDDTDKVTWIDTAVLVQCTENASWGTGLHFEPNCKGTRAIWVQGEWNVGLDVGDNNIRMNKDAELQLEETGRFYVKFNSSEGRIEFHNRDREEGDRVIGFIPGDAPEHAL